MSFIPKSSIDHSLEPEFGYRQLVAALIRRKFWFLGVFSTVLLGALVMSLRQELTYESTMQLIVEPNYRQDYDPSEENQSPSDRQRETDYVTQLKLMRNHDLLQTAANSLAGVYPDLEATQIDQGLAIRQVEEDGVETRIVSVAYSDTSPQKAQQVLEALKLAYQDYSLMQQSQRLSRGLESINQQLDEAQEGLRDSQQDLQQFRQNEQLVDPQAQATALSEDLNAVIRDRYALQKDYQGAIAQYETLRQQLNLPPEEAFRAARLSQSPRFQSLLNALQQTELELSERRAVYLGADPGVEILAEKRQNQIALLNQEGARVLGESPAAFNLSNTLQGFNQLSDIDLALVSELAATQGTVDSLAASAQTLAETEQAIRAELSEFPELISKYDQLQPEIETEQTVLEQLLTQRELLSAELAKEGFSWQLIASPQPGRPADPTLLRNLLLGGVLGLFLGGLAAFIRESMDTTVRTPAELRKHSRMPVLGVIDEQVIPRSFFIGLIGSTGWLDDEDATDRLLLPVVNTFDLLFKMVQRRALPSQESLAVMPLVPDGDSIGFLLALGGARMGRKVAYIEADLHHPKIAQLLNLPDEGLSNFMASGDSTLQMTTVKVWNASIDVLPAGAAVLDSTELLVSARFKALIKKLENQYDFVFVETPAMQTADAQEISSVTQGTLVVAALNQIRQADLQQCLYSLDDAKTLGVIASSFNSTGQVYSLLSQACSSQKLLVEELARA